MHPVARSLCITFGFALLGSQAQAQQLAPGEYLAEHGRGVLQIKPGKAGKLPFSLDTVGANYHSCTASGDIAGNRATLTEGGERCEINFVSKGGAITVSVNDACQYYCGARATLDGVFTPPPAGCKQQDRTRTRKEFKAFYDQKKYQEALDKLNPMLQNCGKFMEMTDEAWIRNDVALTQYKLKSPEACLQTLQPLAEDAAKSVQQVRETYAPSEADGWLPVLKATRTNLALCKGK